MSNEAIYLDYHATTPVDRRVVERMMPFFTQAFGNPSSRTHAFGWHADAAVSDARLQVMDSIDARSPEEIVFTSGATEANNTAIRGVVEASGGNKHIITSAIEHPSVLEVCQDLGRRGCEVSIVGVSADGLVDPDEVRAAIRPDTALISIMAVNNEVGTIQPIEAIGSIARAHDVPFHCDASQAACYLDLSVQRAHIDLLSLSSHKLYGPKGVGALYIRRRPFAIAVARQQLGGGQERGMRAGTLNVPGIVGFGEAARLARSERAADSARARAMRDSLLAALRAQLPQVRVHGSMHRRVPCNLNFALEGIPSDTFLASVPQLAISGGAACSSGKAGGSHVLAAMGYSPEQSRCAIRLSVGRMTRPRDAETAARTLISAAHRLRNR